MQSQFNFLGLFFGKALFCLFLGLMCFNTHKWFSWACSILFFISTVFYLILGVTFRKEEKSKLQKIMSSPSKEIREVDIKQNQPKV